MRRMARRFAVILCFSATSLFAADELALRLQPALEAITPDGLLSHIKVLASDEFEGRAPGTKGEELSVKYIADQFKQIGLRPGNPDGTYMQEVPLAGIKSEPRMSFMIGDKTIDLKYPDDFVASSARLQPEIKIDKSDVVFVGYGIVAPQYSWDDYKDVDVRGKTLLMLIGDPPVPDPKDPAKLDDKMFKGKAMTYYGRWTYKYEIAAQKGAAAAIIIHETEPAAYPWQVVRSSWGKENFELDNPNKNMDAVSARSWVTLDVAKKLVADSGQDFDALKKPAITKEFRPVRLNAKANIDIKQQIRAFKSHNVIGKLEGDDPKLRDEYVIYTAHWDHLGRHPELQGDQIFNGAIDNASGVASVIELAAAFKKLNPPPKRSVLFMDTTAEEAGLLGAKYYAEHPLYPLEKSLADINIDGINPWGKTHDLEDLTNRNSTLDDLLGEAAARQGRVMKPSSEPEKGGFYRVDSFEFAKAGVPVLHAARGIEIIGKPPEYGKQKRDEFVAKHYHQPSDEVDPNWDLSGAVQDIQLLFEVGYQVTNGDKFPEWKASSEFKVKRDAMLKK
ncbi:MAG TPA: M20/M25/M40 family metallo-hydrolase [Candidatus Limnocylindria bacterium]|nr:M20/M25/M40 family metallo-hydrolase [Candidatus Limnocylindria bacterium]